MAAIHDDNSLKMALINEDMAGDQTKESFAAVCEQANTMVWAHEIGGKFASIYTALSEDSHALVAQIKSDMLDNYMIAVFMLKQMQFPTDTPLVAWAAGNKMRWEGWKGEIATIRTLMWAGYDPSVPDPSNGATALHAMCNLQWGHGAHPRAVFHLLEGGANPNATTDAGDTPLITLCGHTGWSDDMSECFKGLYSAGADADFKASDGVSAWALLQQMERQHPNPVRKAFIAEVEAA